METIALARGVPSPDLLPVAELADCARVVLERDGRRALNYGPVSGYPPLREWLAARHGVPSGQIMLTNGSLQGLDLLVARFAGERRLVVEAPTYDRALAIARRHDVAVTAVPHEGEGLDPDELRRELARDPSPALLYLLPTFQNPSGRTLSLERRRRIVELAGPHDLLVVEDDPYSAVRFEGEAAPALAELAPGGPIVYSSSFSKIVAPGLRVGYLVLPGSLASELEAAAVNTYLAPALPTQAIAFEFVARGQLEPNLARVRAGLLERRDAMLAALERELAGTSWNRPEGGYFLWLELPDGADGGEVADEAAREGVTVVPGRDFFLDPGRGRRTARLAFSFVTPGEISEGIARLAGALERSVALERTSVRS